MSTKSFFFSFFSSHDTWGAPEQRTQRFKLLMSILKWVASCIYNQNKCLFWSQTCAISVFTSEILLTCFFNCSFSTFASDQSVISCSLAPEFFDRSTLYWLVVLADLALRNLALLFFSSFESIIFKAPHLFNYSTGFSEICTNVTIRFYPTFY